MKEKIPQIPIRAAEKMRQLFAAYPELSEVKVFGSRATGKANERSDIDIATWGITDEHRLGRLALALEEIPIPQKWDIQSYENIAYPPLKRHIDAFGVTLYLKK